MEVPHQTDIVFFLVIGMTVLLLLAISIILFFRLYTKKILRQQAQLLRAETRHQEELLFSIISSVEAERKRIATDIHDEIGSIFSTLSIFVNKLGSSDTNLSEETVKSLALIEKGMVTVRRIAHTMMPHELEMFGLIYTIENLCDKLQSGGCIDTSFRWSGTPLNTTQQIDLAVYRILQELTSNTIKHANATRITIDLLESTGSLRLVYTDDGKGVDTSSLANAKGLGMKNIESRVNMVKGKITYSSTPLRGIHCRVEIPLTQNAAI